MASIGPVCDPALRTFGVAARVQPAHPEMGAMIAALTEYVEQTAQA